MSRRTRLLVLSPSLALAVTLAALTVPARSQAQPQLTITPGNLTRGFVITQFASGFGWRGNGVAFLPGGEVLVSDPLAGGKVYRFPTHADGQVADDSLLFQSAPDFCPQQMVQVLDNGVWHYYGNYSPQGDIAEFDSTTGDPIRFLGLNNVYGNSGMAAFPPGVSSLSAGHIFYVADTGGSGLSIWEVDPVTSVFTFFANPGFLNQAQILISPDGTTLYAMTQVEDAPGQLNPHVVALAIPGGNEIWSSPSHPEYSGGNAYSGMALGAGTLDGYIYVSGYYSIWEFGLPGGPYAGVDSLFATTQPPTPGEQDLGTMFVDPYAPCPGGYPSLLICYRNHEILRIDPPGGGWFGCPTSTLTTGGGGTTAAPEPAGSGDVLRLATARNPAAGSVEVSFTLDREGIVRLDVLDPQGRVVAVLDEGPRAAGPHRVTWNRMTIGGPAPAGTYFVRFRDATRSVSRKVTLLE